MGIKNKGDVAFSGSPSWFLNNPKVMHLDSFTSIIHRM